MASASASMRASRSSSSSTSRRLSTNTGRPYRPGSRAESPGGGGGARQLRAACAYISEPGVVSSSPVSSRVFRPERICGQPP